MADLRASYFQTGDIKSIWQWRVERPILAMRNEWELAQLLVPREHEQELVRGSNTLCTLLRRQGR